jgi:hypothetical protein
VEGEGFARRGETVALTDETIAGTRNGSSEVDGLGPLVGARVQTEPGPLWLPADRKPPIKILKAAVVRGIGTREAAKAEE